MIEVAEMISHIESLDNTHAMRFEVGVFLNKRYEKFVPEIKKANSCSNDTARMISATSWGMYQMMGFNLYEMYPSLKLIDYLQDEGLQHKSFFRFTRARKIDFSMRELQNSKAARTMFAKVYNGDGIEYSKRMEIYMTNKGLKYVD